MSSTMMAPDLIVTYKMELNKQGELLLDLSVWLILNLLTSVALPETFVSHNWNKNKKINVHRPNGSLHAVKLLFVDLNKRFHAGKTATIIHSF